LVADEQTRENVAPKCGLFRRVVQRFMDTAGGPQSDRELLWIDAGLPRRLAA
jgi:hypothetical protein